MPCPYSCVALILPSAGSGRYSFECELIFGVVRLNMSVRTGRADDGKRASVRKTRRNGASVKIKWLSVIGIFAGIALMGSVANAQSGSKAKTAHGAATEAMFGVRSFPQAEVSPDGKRVAWVESLPGAGGAPSPNSAIYVAEISAPAAKKRITAGDGKAAHEEHDIAWSSDSKRLAFLSDSPKAGQLQLFVADLSGGAAKQLTHVKGFLAGPGWSPDSKTIALLFTENATRAAGHWWRRRRMKAWCQRIFSSSD